MSAPVDDLRWLNDSYLIDFAAYLVAGVRKDKYGGLKLSHFRWDSKVFVLGHREFDEKGCADGGPRWVLLGLLINDAGLGYLNSRSFLFRNE